MSSVSSVEKRIWDYFKSKGLSEFGVAGLMGNLFAESSLIPNNLQNTYNTRLNLSDAKYTDNVDNGRYTNFVNDNAGYGLAQWTHYTRKKSLLDFAKSKNKSIGDLDMQLEFIYKELSISFKSVLTVLKSASSVKQASDIVLTQFEKPANMSDSVKSTRVSYGQKYYDKYATVKSSISHNVADLKIVSSILTKNPCYTAGRTITVKGLMIHSVGCPQPNASVFVKNWNSESYSRACVHAFIDANTGVVYQTLPWNHRGWHGGGDSNNTHIGVEMCEPACIKYTTGANFTCSNLSAAREAVTRTYESAVSLFAYLCKQFNLNPLADGVIISHKEGGKRGIASGHVDPEHLWSQLNLPYTMDTFRADVKKAMNSGVNMESSDSDKSSSTVINTSTAGQAIDDLSGFVKIIYKGSDGVNFRKTPSLGNNVSTVLKSGVFTVVGISADKMWYKLKSGLFITTDDSVVKFTASSSNTSSTNKKVSDFIIASGAVATLVNTPIYASSVSKNSAGIRSGTFYIWSDVKVNNRVRITNKLSNVGVNGQVTGWVNISDIEKTSTSASINTTGKTETFEPYIVRITAAVLNIRKGAGTNFAVAGTIKKGGAYTIVEESAGTGSKKGWGLLKSKAGWISLDHVAKL